MEFLTREVFDTLIVILIIIGVSLAIVRLYADLTRTLPPEKDSSIVADTEPRRPDPDAHHLDDESGATASFAYDHSHNEMVDASSDEE